MPSTTWQPLSGQGRALSVIAAGGALGALGRWLVGLAFPTAAGRFPWATFGINVAGGLLIGLLIVIVVERRPAPALVRPFLVTGVLGGFTTFSTYAVDSDRLLAAGQLGVALLYLVATLLAALGATAVGLAAARALVPPR